MKKWVVIAFFLVFAGALVAYWFANQPRPGLDQEDASFSLSATGLAALFASNEAAANEKYLGQVLEVYGKVSEILAEQEKYSLLLDGGSEGMVYCAFADTPQGVELGEFITVKGRCSGYLMDVILNDCIISEN